MDNPQFDQTNFHGREDDGNETGASFIGAANSDWTQDIDVNFRCRFVIAETDGIASTNFREDIQFQLNGGGWNAVLASGSAIIFATSANYADGDHTTQQLGGGTFLGTNEAMTHSNSFGNGSVPDFSGSDEFECELCLQIEGASVNDTDLIELRMTEKGTAFLLYASVPKITVNKPSGGARQRLMIVSSWLPFLFVALFAACASFWDMAYVELTGGYADGDLDPKKNDRVGYDTSETMIALTLGLDIGAYRRDSKTRREMERGFKYMVAASDRNQLAFLTGQAQHEATDALGNPLDALSGYIEPPKNMNEALVGLIGALSLAIAGFTFYWLRKQHQLRRSRTKESPADA